MNTIKIEGPFFNSAEDEDLFFLCIYNLPGYEKVTGVGTVLTISFKNQISGEVRGLIEALCSRWETSTCA